MKNPVFLRGLLVAAFALAVSANGWAAGFAVASALQTRELSRHAVSAAERLPASGANAATSWESVRRDFGDPPLRWKSRPLWFWNGGLSPDRTRAMLAACQQSGYYGVGILPALGMTPAFMTPEYLDNYQVAVDTAASLGMKLCLYDEYWFPSGAAGGQLAKQYPEALSKRLDMTARDVRGPQKLAQDVPPEGFLGAVAMDLDSQRRLDISANVTGNKLTWDVPAGAWKIMVFRCVRDGARDLVDYLNPDAVKRFIELTYEKYYHKFPTHFGTTIDSAFYDEPTFHWVEGGRAWTEAFNEKFRQKYGHSPILQYPALWFDVGPETASDRNALLGFRAELYATGFPKVLNDWCREHRLELTGHVDQEEIVNPVSLCGDLIKAFKYQDIPAVDQVFMYGRASKAYKLISSAAYNYDRPRVLTECYGGINNMPVQNLYKEAMDQFAKGINMMVPHAVWYAPTNVIFPPELTPGNAIYGSHLSEYNRYMGRLQRLLQTGRHVADIGILYPIATLQAGYYFGPGKPYEGGVIPPEADYMEVGELLALGLRRDFTFIHPETLDQKCRVADARISLTNVTNYEEYPVFILPGSRCIHLSNLQKIKTFFDQGGTVIATTRLPDTSVEPGRDREVRTLVSEIFGDDQPAAGHINDRGGKAFFLATPNRDALRALLAQAATVPDVRIEKDLTVAKGNFSYIHKVIDGRQLFFFANSSETEVDSPVHLRGRWQLERWNPHTGEIATQPSTPTTVSGQDVTTTSLRLAPVHSVFLVERP